MRIECIAQYDKFQRMLPEWRKLAALSSGNDIMNQPEWFAACWQTMPADVDIRVLAFYDDSMAGMLPIRFESKGLFRYIHYLGQPYFIHRSDLIALPGKKTACLEAFVNWLNACKNWDMVSFKNFGMFTDHRQVLRHCCEKKSLSCRTMPGSLNYYIDAAQYQDFETYRQTSISRNSKKNFRRSNKHLKKLEPASWKIYDRIDNDLLEKIIRIDTEKKNQHKDERSYFSLPSKKAFFKHLLAATESAARIQAICLEIENRPVSYTIGFILDNKLFGYQTAYDSAFSHLSPGALTMLKMIEVAINSGIEEIDMLIGDDKYKRVFTPRFRRADHLFIYNRHLSSKMLEFIHNRIKTVSRKLKQQFPMIDKWVVKYKKQALKRDDPQ